jgi:hypothetical protein
MTLANALRPIPDPIASEILFIGMPKCLECLNEPLCVICVADTFHVPTIRTMFAVLLAPAIQHFLHRFHLDLNEQEVERPRKSDRTD